MELLSTPHPMLVWGLGTQWGGGAPRRAQTILTWEHAVSMAAPEVPLNSKQATRALLGARPGWDSGA